MVWTVKRHGDIFVEVKWCLQETFPTQNFVTLYWLYRTLTLRRRSTVVCFVFIEYNQKFFSRESLQNFLELLNLANCGWNTATSCWRIKSASVRTSSKQKAVTVVGERKTKQRNALGRESINSFIGCVLAKSSHPLFYVSHAVSEKSLSFASFAGSPFQKVFALEAGPLWCHKHTHPSMHQ